MSGALQTGVMTRLDLRQGLSTFVELNDLKRVCSAGRSGSIATRMFGEAWAAFVAGTSAANVAGWITGRALAAARLGDIDLAVLADAGVPAADARAILLGAAEAAGGAAMAPLRAMIEADNTRHFLGNVTCPDFVLALAKQPRAGITCPGKPRILLEPPENHADHCLMVAVYGVVLSPVYGADPGKVFLAALSHHFHNAGMPDSGFTGEMLLGRHLETLMVHHTEACLAQLAPDLRGAVVAARSILPNADTAEGRAFHAADVLDRVLQLNQYTQAAALTPERMLGEMELVHAGPVKGFQDDVLRQAGLL